jgi:hypothetical protein
MDFKGDRLIAFNAVVVFKEKVVGGWWSSEVM